MGENEQNGRKKRLVVPFFPHRRHCWLELYVSVELHSSPAYGNAVDHCGLTRSNCIVARLSEAGMIQDIGGFAPNLQADSALWPNRERLYR